VTDGQTELAVTGLQLLPLLWQRDDDADDDVSLRVCAVPYPTQQSPA